MSFDAHSGERLREERQKLGMTQGQMAELAGVRREMWSKYERGVSAPGAPVFQVLGELGIDQLYILTGKRIAPEPTMRLTEDEKELVLLFRNASLQVKAAVLGALTAGTAGAESKKTVIKNVKGGRIAGNNYHEK